MDNNRVCDLENTNNYCSLFFMNHDNVVKLKGQ